MDVFSTLTNPDIPIKLTENIYNEVTKKAYPYVQEKNGKNVKYALCPCCKNPVSMVNQNFDETESGIHYAKHTMYDVKKIADHNQEKYETCDLISPSMMDSKKKLRKGSDDLSNKIKEKLRDHFELLVTIIKLKTNIKFTKFVIAKMLETFVLNQGHKCRCVTLFNMPYSFLYLTDAQSILYCNVDNVIAEAINKNSEDFTCGNYNKITAKDNSKRHQIILFFSAHNHNKDTNIQTIKLNIAEIKVGQAPEQGAIIYTKTLQMDMSIFDNYIDSKNHYLELAKSKL